DGVVRGPWMRPSASSSSRRSVRFFAWARTTRDAATRCSGVIGCICTKAVCTVASSTPMAGLLPVGRRLAAVHADQLPVDPHAGVEGDALLRVAQGGGQFHRLHRPQFGAAGRAGRAVATPRLPLLVRL